MRGECEQCKRHEASNNACLMGSFPSGTSSIMIIGDIPTHHEALKGQYFTGHIAQWFAEKLSTYGIDMGTCYLTKAIKCHHADPVTKSHIKYCKGLLDEEIDAIKPKYILTLGNTALQALTGKGAIEKNRGKAIEYKGAKVLATYNPSAVIRSPKYEPMFNADLQYFANMCQDKWEEDTFKWMLVDSKAKYFEMLEAIRKDEYTSYDIETSCLKDTEKGVMHMLGIGTEHMNYVLYTRNLNSAVVNTIFSLIKWSVAQNSKFDNRWLRAKYGLTHVIGFDTMLALYVLNASTPHDLKYASRVYCNAPDYAIKAESFKEVLTEDERIEMAEYCARDVHYTRKLYPILRDELMKDRRLARVFKHIVMPGERVLQKIEARGAYVDLKELQDVTIEFQRQLKDIDDELAMFIPNIADMNLNSTQQLAKLLFTDLGLPVISYTDSGAPSTGKASLLRLVDKHHVPRLILERRKYSKGLDGFLVPWVAYREKDGRLHTTYNIAKTGTGRLSAEDPNLQQVPRDKRVRNLISAPNGRKFLEADYSQIELRAASYIARADSMKQAYILGEDIHTKTAISVSGKAPDDITKADRTGAKAVNFGYLYGMWWKSFKAYAFDTYGVVVSDEDAMHSREVYFETYPEFVDWHKRQINEVRSEKAVRTPTGRIRHLPNIDSPDSDLRGEAERQSINTPVQSFASDMTLLAMIAIDTHLEEHYAGKALLVGQVHDAILVEADDDVAEEIGYVIKDIMEHVPDTLTALFHITLDVPIVADVTIGTAWGKGDELKPLQTLDKKVVDKAVVGW